jgi:DNA invertase Pin-like site-specific DNA recombinase
MCSALVHFERRLIAERTKGDVTAAPAPGKRSERRPLDPGKIEAPHKLLAARQLGLGQSTVDREMTARDTGEPAL